MKTEDFSSHCFFCYHIKRLLRFHKLAGLCHGQRDKHDSCGHNCVSFPFFSSLLTEAIDGFRFLFNILLSLYQPSELSRALIENSWVSIILLEDLNPK